MKKKRSESGTKKGHRQKSAKEKHFFVSQKDGSVIDRGSAECKESQQVHGSKQSETEKQISEKIKKVKRKRSCESANMNDSGEGIVEPVNSSENVTAKQNKRNSEDMLPKETYDLHEIKEPKRKKKKKVKELELNDTISHFVGDSNKREDPVERKNADEQFTKEGSNVEMKTGKIKSKKAKQKEKKKKRRKKKMAKEGQSEEEEDDSKEGTAQISALEYLRLWANNKKEWKFQKVRQVWLLNNLFNQEKVQDTDFAILLSYLEGLKGKSRQLTLQMAEKIIEMADSDSEDSEEFMDEVKQDRAKQLIQILS